MRFVLSCFSFSLGLGLGLGFISSTAIAEDPVPAAAQLKSCLDPKTTAHSVRSIAPSVSAQIPYEATTGYLRVVSGDGASAACVFFTAYRALPADARRPLIFAFNGGPSVSSIYLHAGFLAPKRVSLGTDGTDWPSSFEMIPNADSILDVADIVFVDPVGTGFSYVESGKKDAFFGEEADYKALGHFIQSYLSAYQRWFSPKFLLGESYGGIRSGHLSRYLPDNLQIVLNGTIMVSPILSYRATYNDPGENEWYIGTFPVLATTAWYHKWSATKHHTLSVEQIYQIAKDFAETRLRAALNRGSSIDAATFEKVATEIADLTGLDKDTVMVSALRIDLSAVAEKHLKERLNDMNWYDTRIVGNDDQRGLVVGSIDGVYAAGFNHYLRQELGANPPVPYQIALYDYSAWPRQMPYTEVLQDLSAALTGNKHFRILVLAGYFDSVCPPQTVESSLAQLPGDAKLRARAQIKYYFGGHMMYLNPKELKRSKADIATFIREQTQTVAGSR